MNIRKATTEEFDSIYADMVKQFPPEELKPREAFQRLFKDESFDAFLVLNAENEPVGYFTAYKIPKEKMVLLDHLAVFEKYHGKGYGTKLLPIMQKHYADWKGLILEVEQPSPHAPNTVRRVRFYKSCGAYKLDMRYLLPGPDGATPMDLYFLNCGNFKGQVKPAEVVPALREVFTRVHSTFPNAKEVWKLLEKNYARGF